MRRTLILTVLPITLCLIPLLAAVLIVLALPTMAKEFYVEKLSSLDVLILGLGSALFVAQLLLAWRALRWRGLTFDDRKSLATIAEQSKAHNYELTPLIETFVLSDLFQRR